MKWNHNLSTHFLNHILSDEDRVSGKSQIERLWKAAVLISWVVADTVYGGNLDLRMWLEAHGYPYVLAVACNEPVGFQTPTGRRREEAALVEAFVLNSGDWQRLSMSEGTKGPRLFDWAIVPMLQKSGGGWKTLVAHAL